MSTSSPSPPPPASSAPPPSSSPSRRVILVTGCAGFIGSHVSAFLLRRGSVVVGLDEMNDYYDVDIKRGNIDRLRAIAAEAAKPSHFTFYESDVDNPELLATILTRQEVTSVIHLAARAGVRPSIAEPHLYTHSNITATLTLLQSIKRHRPQLEHFVYASSSSVYGDAGSSTPPAHDDDSHREAAEPAHGFVESQSTDEPVSVYAASKKSAHRHHAPRTHHRSRAEV